MPNKKISLEDILVSIFDPVLDDHQPVSESLLISVILNPSVDRIKEAMKEACRQTLELAAARASIEGKKKSQHGKYRKWQKLKGTEEVDLFSYDIQYSVDKQSILNTIDQIE